jgi:hypothetical protein
VLHSTLLFGLQILFEGHVVSIFLIPVYKTATETAETMDIRDNIVETTTGHLSTGSRRLAASAVAAYLIFGHTMYLILEEFGWFTVMRHKFLMKAKARNNAVYIRNIPKGFRSNRGISKFFEKSIVGVKVEEAHVALTTKKLQKEKQRCDDCIMKLEHAFAELDENRKRPTHKIKVNPIRDALAFGKEVDSIAHYTKELKSFNSNIAEQINNLQEKASEQPDDQVYDSDDDEELHGKARGFGPSDGTDNDDFLTFMKAETTAVLKHATTTPVVEARGLVTKTAKKASKVVITGEDGKSSPFCFRILCTSSNC